MTNETEKHTPGRLRVQRAVTFCDDDSTRERRLLMPPDACASVAIVAELGRDDDDYGDPAEMDANAERLALCWNQHDALVEAVGELSRWLNWAIERDIAIAGGGADVNAHDMIRNAQARAALAAE